MAIFSYLFKLICNTCVVICILGQTGDWLVLLVWAHLYIFKKNIYMYM